MATLYMYVDGLDLEDDASTIAVAFGDLVSKWKDIGAILVNQRHERTVDMRPDDLADWDLGVNLPVASFGPDQAKELLAFGRAVSRQTSRDFIVGIASTHGVSQDIVSIGENAGQHEYNLLCTNVCGL